MTPRFVFHPGALADLREARDWYEEQRFGLGAELGVVIETTIERILAHPELYPEILPGVRRAVLARFPYALVYRVRGEVIEALAVFHHRRDAQVWQRRAAV